MQIDTLRFFLHKRKLAFYFRSKEEMWTVGWVYPLIGIPLAAPPEESTLGVVQCEAGSQLEKKMDLLLTGCLSGNQDHSGRDSVFIFFTSSLLRVLSSFK